MVHSDLTSRTIDRLIYELPHAGIKYRLTEEEIRLWRVRDLTGF